ncbi:MAG: hypothetical protein V7711_18865 [Pseudomonadales bacterium]
MAIGSWEPEQKTTAEAKINNDILNELLNWSSDDQLSSLESHIALQQQRDLAYIMKLDASNWQNSVDDLNENELICLIRVLTVAEEKLEGWQAGEKSPVIALNKLLRRRGTPLNKEMLNWIKANSSNRFLPNGPLL